MSDEVPVEVSPVEEQVPEEESPVEESPVEESPVEESPVEESPVEPRTCEDILEEERKRSAYYEDRFKRTLADFENMRRKMQSDVEVQASGRFDRFMLDLLGIFDDFERARDAYRINGTDTAGLDSIIRNMHSLLAKHRVTQIPALGEGFDPNLHEAIAFRDDAEIEENTITRELRKGYISSDRVIRPTLVEIARKLEVG